ncbi:hypothetical protein [Fusobacterium sp. PH5-44]|uniref:hypothetical protein n=1 Tax=unclassified Fusobacterium TaxID=2648384 RepID=UPI003D1D71FC
MSNYAYRDLQRKKIIFASETTINDKKINFFCGNSKCNAILRLCSGIKSPYFAALKKHTHIEGCTFANKSSKFDLTKYNENLFVFENIVNEYLTQNVRRIPRRIYTLSQMYHVAKSAGINDRYGSSFIHEILCDNRSNKVYTYNIRGFHLIECKFYSYNEDEQFITFEYPLNDNLKNKYKLKISIINNPELFSFVLKKIYNKNDYPIVIIGNWRLYQGYYITDFTNKHQIYMP